MKQLQTIKNEDEDIGDILFGYYDPNIKTIYINIQYIWKKYKDINEFVKIYQETYNHETLHYCIDMFAPRKRWWSNVSEETIVRSLNGERMTKKLKKYYKKDK